MEPLAPYASAGSWWRRRWGNLNQIYLAIIDHLDAESERLPVFLDEVFVNWDAPRRHAAFEILQDMAQERQLFVFTCHPFFAEETAEHLGAERIDLTARRADGKAKTGARPERRRSGDYGFVEANPERDSPE